MMIIKLKSGASFPDAPVYSALFQRHGMNHNSQLSSKCVVLIKRDAQPI